VGAEVSPTGPEVVVPADAPQSSWQACAVTSPNEAGDRTALVEQRRQLARKRDKALQDLLITREYVAEGRRTPGDMAAAVAEAAAACRTVASFDAEHSHVRTNGDAEDDAQARRFLASMTGF
jgi:hypothetical protein